MTPDPNRPMSLSDKNYSSYEDIKRKIRGMSSGEGIRIDKVGYDSMVVPFGVEEIELVSKDKNSFHAVFAGGNATVGPSTNTIAFCVCLEQLHFTPDTPANNQYELRQFNWEGNIYVIVTIPTEKSGFIDEVADHVGLKVVDFHKNDPFPFDTENVKLLVLEGEEMSDRDMAIKLKAAVEAAGQISWEDYCR